MNQSHDQNQADTMSPGCGDTCSIGESMHTLGDTARDVADRARSEAGRYVESRLEQGAADVKSAAEAVSDAARTIKEKNLDGIAGTLSDYAIEAARKVSDFAESLRGRSVDELAGDLRTMGRNNPTLFVAGSVALGFALARFLRASAHSTPVADGSSADPHLRTGLTGERT